MTAPMRCEPSRARSAAPMLSACMLLALPLTGAWAGDAGSASIPDISGPWRVVAPPRALKDEQGHAPPLTPTGQTAYEHNQSTPKADPILRCLPPGMPRVLLQKGFPFNVVQGASMYAFMFEWNHLNRIVYMNRDHFEGIGPQYFGQSVGHWDGKTLVVESNAYNDSTYLDDSGLPHSDGLTTVERIQLARGGQLLRDTITITDPTMYAHPWTTVLSFRKAPHDIIQEDYCLGRVGLGSLKQDATPATK